MERIDGKQAANDGPESAFAPYLPKQSSMSVLYWSTLTKLGLHGRALEVARKAILTDNIGWDGKIKHSLIALDLMNEVEVEYGINSKKLQQTLWDIAFISFYQNKLIISLSYFLRCLSFSQQPKDFYVLQAYLECLFHANRLSELESLCSYWLDVSRTNKTRDRRFLHIFMALSLYKRGKLEEGYEYLRLVCKDRSRKQCITYFRGKPEFEETLTAINHIIGTYFSTDIKPT